MGEVTLILEKLQSGQSTDDSALLPRIYDELRKLADRQLAGEKPGQTLQSTALVHEVYLRLVDVERAQHWNSRGHFFAAAAEAMRRILVECARAKLRMKRGGDRQRKHIDANEISAPTVCDEILAVHEALTKLDATNPLAAQLVKLRFFVGYTNLEAANALAISPRKASQVWSYARAWLKAELGEIAPLRSDGNDPGTLTV